MKKKSYKNVRKFLYASLFSLIILSFVFAFGGIIADRIDYTNTWQYNATYDFEMVESDVLGEKSLSLNIETPSQLAGAFNALAAMARPGFDTLDGGGPSSPPKAGTSSTSSSKTSVSLNNVADKIAEFEKDSTVIRLTKNLKFDNNKYTWTPVDFSGTFDGAGFVISGLKISNTGNVGFVAKNSGIIKNIIFKDITVTCSQSAGVASKAGIIASENAGTITNVNIIGSSSITGNLNSSSSKNADRELGGIAGVNSGTIKYCINKAAVKYGKHVGGIVGKNTGTVQYCYNYGAVSANETSNKTKETRVGGIIGKATSGKIEYCQNFGTITGESSTSEGNNATGGIVGYSTVAINLCGNHGTVVAGSAKTNTSYAGGIVGYTTANVKDCYNRANVTAYAKTTDTTTTDISYTGNESGEQQAQDTDDIVVALVYNQWRKHTYIYCEGNKGNPADTVGRVVYITKAYAGGIVGSTETSSDKVENCYSTGAITGGQKEYSDTYSYVMLYEQYHQAITAGVYTRYGRYATKVYYTTMRYTYEIYASPMIGSNAGSPIVSSLKNNVGTQSYKKDSTYDYNARYYYYFREGFSPWTFLGGAGLIIQVLTIIDLFDKDELADTKSKTGTESGAKSIKIHSSDDNVFPVAQSMNKIKNLNQYYYVDATNNKAYVKATYTASGSSKTKNLVKNSSGYVSLNQISASKAQYKTMTDADLKNCTSKTALTTLGTNWAQESSRNDGYPYLKNMYWGG